MYTYYVVFEAETRWRSIKSYFIFYFDYKAKAKEIKYWLDDAKSCLKGKKPWCNKAKILIVNWILLED